MSDRWNTFLTEGELKTVGIVVCLDEKQRFLVIQRSDIDERVGQWTIPGGHIDDDDGSIEIDKPNPISDEIEHDDWKWATIDEIKELSNSEIPIYLLEKALEMSKNAK